MTPSPSREFSIVTSVEGARVLVVLGGEIDAYTTERLHEGFQGLGDVAGQHVVVDLHGVGFVDSAGLAALASSLRRLGDEGAAVSLRSVTRQLAKLFEITGLNRLFPLG